MTIIVFFRLFRYLPADWSFVPKFLFPKPFEVTFAKIGNRFNSKKRCESTRWPTPAARERTASADRLPQRRDAPKTISLSRGNSSIFATSCLGPNLRGTCLERFPRAACGRPLLSAFVFSTDPTLWIDTRRIRGLYVTVHVWGLHCLSESLFLHTRGCPGTNLIRSALFFTLHHLASFFLNRIIYYIYIYKS